MDSLKNADAVTPTSSDALTTVNAIAPLHALVLVVDPNAVRLRVYSHCLRSASEVFNAMSGPHWYEGQNPTPESPKEVFLEEDDTDALHTICGVLHHKNEFSTQPPSPFDVLLIASLSDKYQLSTALTYAVTCWLNHRNGKLPILEKGCLLAASFLFQARHQFGQIAQELVLGHRGSFVNLMSDGVVSDVLPLKTLRM